MAQKWNISDFKKIAYECGGECLSTQYRNIHEKLRWRCGKGHTWEATAASVRRGTWCLVCAGKVVDRDRIIQELQEFATRFGGELLTTTYRTAKAPMIFRCNRGHEFESNYDRVKTKESWCPYCDNFRGEHITRLIFEASFLRPFPKARPIWLVNKFGNRLELDGYNQDLKLAFEYQGIQHNKKIGRYFHKNRSFKRQNENDTIKLQLCRDHGITLLSVAACSDFSSLPAIVSSLLTDENLKSPKEPAEIKVTDLDLGRDNMWDQLKMIAEERGLELVTNSYLGTRTKHQFRCCKCNLLFQLSPKKLKAGRWCPNCNKEQAYAAMREDIATLQEIARSRGGLLVSKEYRNDRNKLEWQCSKGHRWEASAGNVKRGSWCPTCVGQPKLTIEYFKQLAMERGGLCHSGKYINAHTKLKWECSEGHVWEATPNCVRRGTWCRQCAYAALRTNRKNVK